MTAHDDLIRSLYTASHQLQLCTMALDAAGKGDSARATREAGVQVLHAIAALVGERAREAVTS